MNDTQKRKHKLKGKTCAPAAATASKVKSTRHWCKGKNGLEHVPVLFYNSTAEKNWGLATEVTERCAACNKVLRSPYELPVPAHEFLGIMTAIRHSTGRTDIPEVVTRYDHHTIGKALTFLQDFADEYGAELTIEFVPKTKTPHSRWYGQRVRMATRQRED